MPVIALISDLGYEDAAVAVAKGLFLCKLPEAVIVDITHEVRPFNTAQAGYVLKSCYESFPEGTFFVGFVDIFYREEPTLILLEYNRRYFLMPDNAVLQLFLNAKQCEASIVKVFSGVHRLVEWVNACIDVISGNGDKETTTIQFKDTIPTVTLDQNKIKCDVLYIDAYENVVLNITEDEFNEYKSLGRFGLNFIQYESITAISKNYADVRKGAKLCRFNEQGFLEISVNNGRAASLFGLRYGSPHNKIYIEFS